MSVVLGYYLFSAVWVILERKEFTQWPNWHLLNKTKSMFWTQATLSERILFAWIGLLSITVTLGVETWLWMYRYLGIMT